MQRPYLARHSPSGLALPLVLAYVGLVVYASLYPFVGWQSQGVMPWDFVTAPWPRYWTKFDVVINVVGYVPLGFLLALASNRSWRWSLLWGFSGAALLAFLMESLQMYLAPRIASNVDWALNALGGLLGSCLATLATELGFRQGWQQWRERYFDTGSGWTLGLLIVWPLALFYPTPIPLGLGHGLGQLLDLETQQLPSKAETLVIGLGLLIPILLSFAITPKKLHRLLALSTVCLAGWAVTSMTHGVSFGPGYATVWLKPAAISGFVWAVLAGFVFLWSRRQLCWVLALMVIVLHITLQSLVALDPYFAQTLMLWEGGRMVRFYGVTQWLGWLWPYATLVLVMARLIQFKQSSL
jgi:VanZ family protein